MWLELLPLLALPPPPPGTAGAEPLLVLRGGLVDPHTVPATAAMMQGVQL